jgi:hypothetical protein
MTLLAVHYSTAICRHGCRRYLTNILIELYESTQTANMHATYVPHKTNGQHDTWLRRPWQLGSLDDVAVVVDVAAVASCRIVSLLLLLLLLLLRVGTHLLQERLGPIRHMPWSW